MILIDFIEGEGDGVIWVRIEFGDKFLIVGVFFKF